MSKARTKKKPIQEVRTDVWELVADKEQKRQMVLTVEVYQYGSDKHFSLSLWSGERVRGKG
ncbi:hypothetical protein NIES4072_59800 [Nostoc commune NIES-4072]|uniref:Uncharacterized protein n=1 Tax=Nostoc commune NIES-4072 TaxID=2005467 RepID=A0A2R5FU32_NOSCO|nr:hypothetical protein [Nostoc commune]BBD66745.1 hypothetical protein NIES4070_31140 [Nostoc commune HK-02]BBD66950.1 hypothetical protein NIES4070_33210 [Nostoc commune HK-02]BBD67860.1 hypothetical protein NIES4070_42540 [Nostoc commune HK-02]BBD68878.1 hypothetical protein NIES4070_52810 [Nostoc commune HK-02]GBG20121.1 hypothetical protein NIES4072_37950 [Nostoc commune NIES-4072]